MAWGSVTMNLQLYYIMSYIYTHYMIFISCMAMIDMHLTYGAHMTFWVTLTTFMAFTHASIAHITLTCILTLTLHS